MIPRDIEKAIQFLLEQGAVTDARQQETHIQIRNLAEENKRLNVTVDKLSGKVDKLADGLHAVGETYRNLVEHARLSNARLSRLEQSGV